MNRFAECLAITLRHEGEWADHPRDPGGATMKGVTLATYRRYRPGATKEHLRAITDAELRRIYREGYWDPVRADALPPGLDLVTFDAAVNSGPGQGAKWTQRALGVADDGKIGPESIAAATRADPRRAINDACDRRLAMLRGLSTWDAFGRGWTSRVEDIRSKALAMAAAPVTRPAPHVPETPKREHDNWLARLIAAIAELFRRN